MSHKHSGRFKAVLIDRGQGTGAKRVMEEHPERGEFIKGFTGWNRVQAGTLTLDHADPLPVAALEGVTPMAQEPPDLLENPSDFDAGIAAQRGPPTYYAAVLAAQGQRQRVLLSQQPRPAVEHRLEVIAEDYLRTTLGLETGDSVELEVYEASTWPDLP